MAKPEPIIPPMNTKLNKVRSEILCLCFFAKYLSQPISRKAIPFKIKKEHNKTFISLKIRFKDIILADRNK